MIELNLCGLLRIVWIAGIFPLLIALMPLAQLASFHELVLGLAKRGKIMQSSSCRFTVPQRFFCHFYVMAVLWTTFLVAATWFYAYKVSFLGSTEHGHMVWQAVFLLLLMEVQVLRRLFETIYVFKYSPLARMHICGYLTGLFFYTAAPLSLCCMCAPEVLCFAANGLKFTGKGMDRLSIAEVNLLEFVNPLLGNKWYAWLGTGIFTWGWIHQLRCHAILGSLRENKKPVDEYIIPHGDWFEHVSSPHYLAEIVVYGGILVASGGTDLTIWLLFGFVVANLVFVAAETQRWYHKKFDDYPSDRFSIIPSIL